MTFLKKIQHKYVAANLDHQLNQILDKMTIHAGAESVQLELPSSVLSHEVKKYVLNEIDFARMEYGRRGYTGSWAEKNGDVTVEDRVFNSYEEAQNYIFNKADKWGPAIAVRYKKVKFKDNNVQQEFQNKLKEEIEKSLSKQNEKLNDLNKDYDEYIKKLEVLKNAISEKIKGMKKSHIPCPHCKSKIAREYLVIKNKDRWGDLTFEKLMSDLLPECSVCKKSLLNDAQNSKLEKIANNVIKKQKNISEFKDNLNNKKNELKNKLLKKYSSEDTPWLVGAFASS